MNAAQIEEAMKRLGLDEESCAVLALLPVVHVAWADGRIFRTERKVIRNAAAKHGWLIGAGVEIIDSWLDHEPGEEIFDLGMDLLQALIDEPDRLPPDLVDTIVSVAMDVAERGGPMGIPWWVGDQQAMAMARVVHALGIDKPWKEAVEDARRGHTENTAPGPRDGWLPGHINELRADPLHLFLELFRAHGDVVRFKFGPKPAHLLVAADAARHVLTDRHDNYVKGQLYDSFRLVTGDGLLTASGDEWRRRRGLVEPGLVGEQIAGLIAVVARATRQTIDELRPHACGAPVDMAAELFRMALRLSGMTLISVDPTDESEEIGRVFPIVADHVVARSRSLMPIPEAIPTPDNKRFNEALGTLDEIVGRMIEQRRGGGPESPDMLSMLLKSRAGDDRLDDREIRDELMNLVLAGHETIASTLSWLLFLMSKHPQTARRVRAEVRDVLGDRDPTIADLPKLVLTKRVILETMRLYPAAWMIPRQAVGDDVIMGYTVPAGSIVVLCPFLTHRHQRDWPNPEGFDPERFTPARIAKRPEHAYLAFAAGPRNCAGAHFAMMQLTIAAAMLLRHYRFDLVAGFEAQLEASLVLRMAGGCAMTLHRH